MNAENPRAVTGDNSAPGLAGEQLRALVTRIESVQCRIDDELEDRKEIYKEAKSNGFDTKTLRKIIALRRRRPEEVKAEEDSMDLYLAAIGVLD